MALFFTYNLVHNVIILLELFLIALGLILLNEIYIKSHGVSNDLVGRMIQAGCTKIYIIILSILITRLDLFNFSYEQGFYGNPIMLFISLIVYILIVELLRFVMIWVYKSLTRRKQA